MTIEELREYAKEVGVPERVFNETFAPFISDKGRVLNKMEALMAKAECIRQAEYWKEIRKFLDRNEKRG